MRRPLPVCSLALLPVVAACAARTPTGTPAAPQRTGAAPSTREAPDRDPLASHADSAATPWRFEGPVLPGTACTEDKVPTWALHESEHRVSLAEDPSLVFELPPDWSAWLEHPRLLVLQAPDSTDGFRPTFELIVGPRCDRVDGPSVHARVAARAWATVLEPETTMRTVRDGQWPASLGNIGVSVILEVELETAAGAQDASLYFTDYGQAPDFVLYAAAACPGRVAPIDSEGPCPRAYRALLESPDAR